VRAELDELHFCSHPDKICKRAVNKQIILQIFFFLDFLSVLASI